MVKCKTFKLWPKLGCSGSHQPTWHPRCGNNWLVKSSREPCSPTGLIKYSLKQMPVNIGHWLVFNIAFNHELSGLIANLNHPLMIWLSAMMITDQMPDQTPFSINSRPHFITGLISSQIENGPGSRFLPHLISYSGIRRSRDLISEMTSQPFDCHWSTKVATEETNK